MKIAVITDTHWGVRGDSKAFLQNAIDFHENVFFPTLNEREIDTIIHLGDLLDRRKYVNFHTSSKLEEHFMRVIKDNDMNLHLIVGNHDSYYKNTNEVNGVKELYGKSYDNIHIYEHEPVELDFDGCKVMLSPWICQANHDVTMKAFDNTKAQILMGHFEISGYEMMKGQLCDHGLDRSSFNKFDAVYSGHFHHPSSHSNITYLGAPYEMTWSDHGGKRGFHIFDTNTRKMEFIENPYRMFHKIDYEDSDLTIDEIANLNLEGLEGTYVKVIVKNKTNPYLFDIFMDRLDSCNAADIRVVEDHLDMDAIEDSEIVDEAQDTLTILKKYVESMEVKVDKKEVDKCLQSLYNEALSL
jgi:DNA repair exonuclease SbcCD nuclease subunit